MSKQLGMLNASVNLGSVEKSKKLNQSVDKLNTSQAGENSKADLSILSKGKNDTSGVLGKVSLIQMIDNLATQKKLTGLKMAQSKDVPSARNPIRNQSSMVSARMASARQGGAVDLKIKPSELSNLTQEISSKI